MPSALRRPGATAAWAGIRRCSDFNVDRRAPEIQRGIDPIDQPVRTVGLAGQGSVMFDEQERRGKAAAGPVCRLDDLIRGLRGGHDDVRADVAFAFRPPLHQPVDDHVVTVLAQERSDTRGAIPVRVQEQDARHAYLHGGI